MRQPLGRTAACERGRPRCSPRLAMPRRPPVRNACAGLFTRRAAKCRRRRRIRRSRTTAPASTAGCSRTASTAGRRRKPTSTSIIRCSGRSAMRSRISPRHPEARTCRRHRRLLGAELRGAAGRLALAFARLASGKDDPVYGNAPKRLADAMTAHPDMVSGERRNDLALMRAGRGDWVTKIGAEGVQALGVRSRGIGHRRQGRSTGRSAACIRPPWRHSTHWACSMRRSGRSSPSGAQPACGITAASSPAKSARCVVLDKFEIRGTRVPDGGITPSRVNLRRFAMVFRSKREPRPRDPGNAAFFGHPVSAREPVGRTCRSAGITTMIQGPDG